MVNPYDEVRAFVRAALVDPVPRDHSETDAAFRRRRTVAIVTLLVGSAVLAWALRIEPGDDTFYLATILLAAVWGVGAVLSGPLHLGRAHTRTGASARPVVQSLVLGLALLVIFLAGAALVVRVPLLREPVEGLLAHAEYGSLWLVAAITALNGVAEEVYFRGAAFAAVGRRHAVLVTTLGYALVTAFSGVPLLVFAAACLGLVTGLQRRVTGGILGPIVIHLVWSLGMLFLLPAWLRILG